MKDIRLSIPVTAILVVLIAVAGGAAHCQEKQPTPEEVVIEANKAEYALYNDLESKEAAERVKQFFTGDRLENIEGRVRRAIKRKDKAKSAWNEVKIQSKELKPDLHGQRAIVKTLETGELEWAPSGIRWPEHGPTKDLPHTYTLVKIDGVWKVANDEFEQ